MSAARADSPASHSLSTLSPTSAPSGNGAPQFTKDSAAAKVKKAQDLWNTMDPSTVALAYTPDSIWRNRDQFFQGRDAIERFLTDKWSKETSYKLKKQLFAFEGNKIAVNFWTFAPDGLMQKRHMSGNEIAIQESERWFQDGVDVDQVHISDRDG
ncbi:hypothetical protein JCM10213_008341 [Rhodosporidiobolus nylandii]